MTPDRDGIHELLATLPRVKITPQTITQVIIDRWYETERKRLAAIEEVARERDQALAKLADLEHPPSDRLPEDRDGIVVAWFDLYLRWAFQKERADKAEAERADAIRLLGEVTGQRDEAQAALDRVRALIARLRAKDEIETDEIADMIADALRGGET